MGKLAELKANGEFEISVAAVSLPDREQLSLEKQVEAVADRVTEMARAALGSRQN